MPDGAGSREHGAGSIEQGAGSMEQGTWSKAITVEECNRENPVSNLTHSDTSDFQYKHLVPHRRKYRTGQNRPSFQPDTFSHFRFPIGPEHEGCMAESPHPANQHTLTFGLKNNNN
ncbi:MAG: hypothetical protein AMS27_17760 [Bacteroides sp. SM23_62_1]|nr:MAG: hypothetical protein AMS27_17760 [Bacteroides sp. SM23_62_1]